MKSGYELSLPKYVKTVKYKCPKWKRGDKFLKTVWKNQFVYFDVLIYYFAAEKKVKIYKTMCPHVQGHSWFDKKNIESKPCVSRGKHFMIFLKIEVPQPLRGDIQDFFVYPCCQGVNISGFLTCAARATFRFNFWGTLLSLRD